MKKNSEDPKENAFDRITRERVDNFIKLFDEFRNNDFKGLVTKVEQMGRRPTWAVSTIIWILSSLAVALLVRAFILGA